jgi:hypothetical protein
LTFTFDFDANQIISLINIVLAITIPTIGLIAFCTGLYMLRRSQVNRRALTFYRRRWQLDASIDDATLCTALRVYRRIMAWQPIFMGPGVILISMAWLSMNWFIEGNIRFVGIFNGCVLTISIMIPIVVLGCAGRAYGIRRMRAMAKNQPTFGDLQPRLIRHYAPAWTGVVFAIWFSALLLMTAITWTFTRTPLRIRLGLAQWIYLPFGRLGLLVIPLLAALLLALGIGMLRWMVALPRLKSFDEIPDIGVFDVHFRRESILSTLTTFVQLMFFSIGIQFWLLLDNVPPRPSLPIILICATMLGNCIVSMVITLTLYFNKTIGRYRNGRASMTL